MRSLPTLNDLIEHRPPAQDDALGWLNVLYQYMAIASADDPNAKTLHSKTIQAVQQNPSPELLNGVVYATVPMQYEQALQLITTCVNSGAFTWSALLQQMNHSHPLFSNISLQEEAWQNLDADEFNNLLCTQWHRPFHEWCFATHPMWNALRDTSDADRNALAKVVLYPAVRRHWPIIHDKGLGTATEFHNVLTCWSTAWHIHPAQIIVDMLLEKNILHVDIRNNMHVYLQAYPAEVKDILDYHGHPMAREWLKYVPSTTNESTIPFPHILCIAHGSPFHPFNADVAPTVELALPAL